MPANQRPLIANIYNPHNQTKAELVAGFVVRKKFFEKIFRDIQTSTMQRPEQHYIIQGVRGMGKTTLLLRIAYEIENTDGLNSWLIPVVFNEEEYGIGSLADVWEKVAEYLEESSTEFSGLHQEIIKHYQSDDYERLALDLIIKTLQKQQKKILLLIDNIGDILEKFDEQEEQRLREVLLTTPEIRLIGATSVFLERFFDYKRPFFDFFKYLYLDGLNKAESLDLMLKLGEAFHAENIEQIVNNESYRIEVLRRLTGGVIRSMVLLFEIFVENNTGSAFKDLEVLIDRVTPLYKDRMDDLPKQQQKIVAALANFWEAATTKELAEAVRMESKVVSAQLMQLIKNRVVVKIETPTKNHAYLLDDRFFNIWYLMRFGRKTDHRMLWLVKFLEDFIAGDETLLQKRVESHLTALNNGTIDPKAALYLTEAFSFLVKDNDEQHDLIEKTREYLIRIEPNLVDELGMSDKKIIENCIELISEKNYQEAILKIQQIKNNEIYKSALLCYCNLKVKNFKDAEKYFFKSFSNGNEEMVPILFMIYLFAKHYSKNEELSDSYKLLSSLQENDLEYNTESVKSKFNISDKQVILGIVILFGVLIYLFKSDKKEKVSKNQLYAYFFYLVINEGADIDITQKYLKYAFSEFTGKDSESSKEFIESTIKYLLKQKQYHLTYKYFQDSKMGLKNHFPPLYYATLHYLKEEYPIEYLRMPPELKETVEELVAEIDQMAIDYA